MRCIGWIGMLAGLGLLLAVSGGADAQATRGTGAAPFKFVISEVRGLVQVRQLETDHWQAAKVGADWEEGAEFRTGPRSLVRFLLPPDQEVTLDRLGLVKVLRAELTGNKAQTDLGMKYGRVQYDVEQSGLRHEATIHSPGATLAVTGTKQMGLYDQGFYATQAYARQPVVFRNIQGRLVRFGQQGGGLAKVSGEHSSAAEDELSQSVINPNTRFVGLTPSEVAPIFHGFFSFARPQDIQFSVLGRLFSNDFKGSAGGTLPIGKQLRILMIWTGLAGSDVDLSVISPTGEVVSRQHPRVPSSGHYLGNGVADTKGTGAEQIVFERSFIPGQYTIQEKLNTPGSAKVNVFVIRDPLGKGTSVGTFQETLTSRKPTAQQTVNVDAGLSRRK
jgi:hypothetical protein